MLKSWLCSFYTFSIFSHLNFLFKSLLYAYNFFNSFCSLNNQNHIDVVVALFDDIIMESGLYIYILNSHKLVNASQKKK